MTTATLEARRTLTVAPSHTLVDDRSRQYDFRPRPDGTVTVIRRAGLDVRTYPLPQGEARALYARLRKQGFRPW